MPVLRHVYDSLTGTYLDVEVSEEVYHCYRRATWLMQKQDRRFYAHETQFTSLTGGQDATLENFDEFRVYENDPERLLCDRVMDPRLADAFWRLTPAERRLLSLLVIEGYTERWYAQRTGLSQKTIHNKKVRALKKMKRFLLQNHDR